MRSGSSGTRPAASSTAWRMANPASRAIARRPVHQSADRAMAKTPSMTPAVASSAPSPSAPWPRPRPGSPGRVLAAARPASSPTGRFTKKIQCQLAYWTSKPPATRPAEAPTAPVKANAPMARACFLGSVKSRTSMPSATADTRAAPAPWTNRAAMSIPGLAASPHASEARVNSASPARNIRLRPSRSPSLPPSSSSPPKAIR
jgi:hypothetical protein